jgi:competence protein ComGC
MSIFEKKMFKIILVISLILLALPFLTKKSKEVKSYVKEKVAETEVTRDLIKKSIKYSQSK